MRFIHTLTHIHTHTMPLLTKVSQRAHTPTHTQSGTVKYLMNNTALSGRSCSSAGIHIASW